MEPVVHLQGCLLSMLSNVHGLRLRGLSAVVRGNIESRFAAFQIVTFVAPIDALFLTTDRVGTFAIRGDRSEGTGVICRPAGAAPFT